MLKDSPYKQKDLIVPVLLGVTALLIIAAGVYLYENKKVKTLSHQNSIKYKVVPATNPQYSYPLITDYSPKAIMDKVNKTLAETYKGSGCDPETPKDTSEWDVKIAVDYAQNDIFSVNARGRYYCGGPYPTNNYSSTLTFDMKTGEQITFEKLFKNYEQDKKQIINAIYADVIAKTTEYMTKHPTDDDCGKVNTSESLSDYSQDYRLSSTTKAVYVRPNYPHVIEACIAKVEVSVQKLLPFIDPASILHRIEGR